MGWLFAQVWLLCVIAFLAGAVVTWLVFVLPLRGPAHPPYTPVPAWAATHRPRTKEPPPAAPPTEPPPPPVDPALSGLDTGRIPRVGTGTAAAGALDALGAPRSEPEKPPPEPDS